MYPLHCIEAYLALSTAVWGAVTLWNRKSSFARVTAITLHPGQVWSNYTQLPCWDYYSSTTFKVVRAVTRTIL